MPDAIALGELLIDFVSIEKDVALADLPSFAGAAGGAPANVAVGLAKLGVSAGFVGKVGDDPFGEHLRRVLEEQGVDTSGLRTARNVRTTLAFVATRSDGRKDICFYRHPGADMLLTGEEVSSEYLRSARLFHFGSVALSRSPAREATVHAAEAAREAGLFLSYDPNWRPTLWEEPVAARGQIWLPMSLADVLHCSEEEWEFITGGSDLEAGAARILATGPDLVVVTRGDRGCYYDDGASRGEVPGFAVEVVDPLGAGDAFVAAMLSRLLEEPRPRAVAIRLRESDEAAPAESLAAEPQAMARRRLRLSDGRLREIMTFANAAGALACTRRGVIPALPTREEIAAFLAARSA